MIRRFLNRSALSSALLSIFFFASAVVAMAQTAIAPDYPPVLPGKVLQFPADYGAHPDFRTEWWYITGWVEDEEGQERGFQLTFFRVRTLIGEDNPSQFAPRQLMLAHAAIADPAHGRLRHAERAARSYPGLAGAASGKLDVQLDDWSLITDDSAAEEGVERYLGRIEADDFALQLSFETDRAPILNGVDGFSQKAAPELNASYYYSQPQLVVSGTLRIEQQEHQVHGRAWLDHEWSSAILPEGAQGWDWLGINLHDGGSLMLFQMRDAQQQAMWAAGSLSDQNGRVRTLQPADIRFSALRHWQSPRSQARYPVAWQIELADGRTLRVEPLLDDQELDSSASTGAIYWEGAVRVHEIGAGGEAAEIGRGYLEMTGYAARLQM